VIQNEEEAVRKLKNVGYYRFSAYMYPLIAFPKEMQRFKPQSSFSTAITLYEFDCSLRQLLFHQIGKVEVAVRSALANIVTAETGNIFWMTDPSYFIHRAQFDKTLAIIQHELEISKEEFILHFRSFFTNRTCIQFLVYYNYSGPQCLLPLCPCMEQGECGGSYAT
jgi:abortive infection bacteriophage resistance protein